MSVIGRKYIFIPGNKILAEEWNGELDQLYRFFNGQLAANVILGQSTSNPNLIVENVRAGATILGFKKGNSSVLEFLVTQQLKSLVTLTSPFSVVSTTKVNNLNATYLDGRSSSQFLLNGKKVRGFIPIDFGVENLTTLSTANNYIVGQITNGNLLSVKYALIPNPTVEGASVSFTLKKNGASIDTGTLNQDRTGEPSLTHSLAVGIVDGDLLSVQITDVTAPDGIPNQLSARIEFEQDLIT